MCVSLQHSILPRQEQETQQSQEARCNSASVFFFPLFFHCCHAVCCCCCVPVPHRRLLTFPQLWYNSSRTSRSSFCDSYERCFCVCVCVCAYHPEHKEGIFQPTLAPNFKSTHAVQLRYNTSEPLKPHTHRNACVPPFQVATLPGFQANHIPKGDLVRMLYRLGCRRLATTLY